RGGAGWAWRLHPPDRVHPRRRAREADRLVADQPLAAAGARRRGVMAIQAALLPDGRRLHLHDGPIDIVLEAWGDAGEIKLAYDQAAAAFRDVLPGLVAELSALREPLGPIEPAVGGPVARRMLASLSPCPQGFITPLAA